MLENTLSVIFLGKEIHTWFAIVLNYYFFIKWDPCSSFLKSSPHFSHWDIDRSDHPQLINRPGLGVDRFCLSLWAVSLGNLFHFIINEKKLRKYCSYIYSFLLPLFFHKLYLSLFFCGRRILTCFSKTFFFWELTYTYMLFCTVCWFVTSVWISS